MDLNHCPSDYPASIHPLLQIFNYLSNHNKTSPITINTAPTIDAAGNVKTSLTDFIVSPVHNNLVPIINHHLSNPREDYSYSYIQGNTDDRNYL